jgi:putative ABC transport system permease protein
MPGIAGGVLILAGFSGIAIWLSGSWKMGLYFIAGLAAGVALLAAVASGLLWGMRRTVRLLGTRLPAVLRHGFANLYRPGNQASSVLVALGVGVMFTLTTYLLQQTVLRQVRGEGTNGSGNVFLLDVRKSSAIAHFIEGQKGVSGPVQLVGYIVSRLVSRNGVPAAQLPLPAEHKSHLQTLRLTTATTKPAALEVQQGHWWREETTTPQLAMSDEAARYYGLKLGDRLRFEVVGQRIDARIVAVFRRSSRALVRYDLVFPQNVLQHLPLVYYGAVNVRPEMIPSLEEKLFERYPTVTVMNLADVLHRIQQAVDQVAVVIRFLTLFAILSGVIILSSSVAGTRYRRVQEVAILKTLGATRARVSGIFSVEFSVLGAVAGIVGGLMANVFTKAVADKFLQTSFAFDWVSWLLVVMTTILLANIAGWLASARILGQRPLEVLRGE